MRWATSSRGVSAADRPRHHRCPDRLAITGEKQAIVIGTITGAAYGLVALGLVLIYKSSGVFNFAQGEFRRRRPVHALSAALQRRLRLRRVRSCLVAAMVMGFTEAVVVRPLFGAPRAPSSSPPPGWRCWRWPSSGSSSPRGDRPRLHDDRPAHHPRRADLRPALVADRHPCRAGAARPVLHQPTSGWRSWAPPGARRHRAGRDQRAPRRRHLGAGGVVGAGGCDAVPETGQFTPG